MEPSCSTTSSSSSDYRIQNLTSPTTGYIANPLVNREPFAGFYSTPVIRSPSTASISQHSKQVIVGDRLMVVNEKGGLDDPRGIHDSIHPDQIHIKRPMNAFMCWAQIARRRLADEKPELRNTELSKILGRMWKELSDEQKTPYIKKAEKLRLQHKSQYPNYKYRPKRKRHSKYAIVPSPEQVLSVSECAIGNGSQRPPRTTVPCSTGSSTDFMCSIVKEENLSIFPRPTAYANTTNNFPGLFQPHYQKTMSDILREAATSGNYPGYYRTTNYPIVTTAPFYQDLSSKLTGNCYQTKPESYEQETISSPTITSSTMFMEPSTSKEDNQDVAGQGMSSSWQTSREQQGSNLIVD